MSSSEASEVSRLHVSAGSMGAGQHCGCHPPILSIRSLHCDKQRQQKSALLVEGTSQKEIPHANTFLDRIALLFARYKSGSKSENVTATALVLEPSKEGKPAYRIVVAKNAGPEGGRGGEDEQFTKKLEGWLSDAVFACSPDGSEESKQIWHQMQEWWLDRTDFYAKKLSRLCRGGLLFMEGDNAKDLGDIADYADLRKDLLDKDLKEIQAIERIASGVWDVMKALQDERRARGSNRAQLNGDELRRRQFRHYSGNRLHEKCFEFRRRSPWQDYSKIKSFKSSDIDVDEEKFEKAGHLVKIVKHIETLGVFRASWDAFAEFCMQNGKPTIHIEFLETESHRLRKILIKPMLEKWRDLAKINPNDVFQADNFETILQQFDRDESVKLWFHCELQLLAKFHTSEALGDCYHYFGCSKPSCLFCWAILHAQDKFRTGASSLRISANCAFPFTISNATWPLINALKVQQDRMLNFMTEQAFGRELDWTEYQGSDQARGKGSTFPHSNDVEKADPVSAGWVVLG